jgi:hypothetical protein
MTVIGDKHLCRGVCKDDTRLDCGRSSLTGTGSSNPSRSANQSALQMIVRPTARDSPYCAGMWQTTGTGEARTTCDSRWRPGLSLRRAIPAVPVASKARVRPVIAWNRAAPAAGVAFGGNRRTSAPLSACGHRSQKVQQAPTCDAQPEDPPARLLNRRLAPIAPGHAGSAELSPRQNP